MSLPFRTTDSSDAACAIFESVVASLILAKTSSPSLSLPRLLSLKDRLEKTLTVVNDEIRTEVGVSRTSTKNVYV